MGIKELFQNENIKWLRVQFPLIQSCEWSNEAKIFHSATKLYSILYPEVKFRSCIDR